MMIDRNNNPWLGLSSYQTGDSFRFFGREREIEEIGSSIKDNYCTVLYGVSGAGKTSLINAGLSPKMAMEGYLPITLRLEHGGRSYSRQIIDACFNALRNTGAEYECPLDTEKISALDACDALWIFFHASTFWSGDNRKLVPVLFIDQFEEIFTLSESEEQTSSFFRQIDSLFGSVPSEKLISQLEVSDISFDFSENPRFRMVISIREDFLARLEDYCYDLPILRRNRIGLRKMNGIQALNVIMKPQSGLVSEDVALKIVSAVTGKDCVGNKSKLPMLSVDTSLLSLFCSELYQLAADKNAGIITSDIVETEGGDIIKHFYEKNLSKLSGRGRRYLEQHLLTSGGFRNQLAVEDINYSLIKKSDIKALESSRIIRKEIINGTERIEFTHDILCNVAMESRRKAKDRKAKLSPLISYGVFALVFLFLVWQTVDFFSVNLWAFSGRFRWIFDTIPSVWWLELRYLLKIFYGFLLLPLCSPTSKKKVPFVDIILIAFGLAVIFFGPNLPTYLNGAARLSWAEWVALLTVVPIVNLLGRSPRISFKDYCKNIFNLSLNQKDKWTGNIVFILFLWGEYRLLREFHIISLLSAAKLSVAAVILECILASIVIVLLFAAIASAFVPSYRGKEARKRVLALSTVQICLVSIYLLSRFVHIRWTSYVALASLLATSVYALRKDILSLFKDRKYIRCACSALSVMLLYFTPNYVSNVNILALKDNAISLDKHYEIVMIESPDGHYGAMEGSEIIVPPVFESIRGNGIDRYSIFDRNSENSRIRTMLARIFGDKVMNYFVRDDSGNSFEWNVLEHPEVDNKYTRSIPRYAKVYETDEYIMRVAVGYYYQKAVVESDASYQKDFDSISRRLATYKCKYPLLPENIYEGLKGIIDTKAIKSERMLDYLLRIIDSYSDGEYYVSKAKCKGLIYLLRGEYDQAAKYAKIASDDKTLAEALILMGDSGNSDLIGNLISRTDSEGRFIGEAILDEIVYLGDEKALQDATVLDGYAALPKDYKESVSLNLSLIRRTLPDGRVLFLESGRIDSEYQKVVYPSNSDNTSYGVYFRDEKVGYVDWEGHELTDAKFDHAWLFSEYNGLAVAELDGKIGFLNSNGNYSVYPNIRMPSNLRNFRDWIFEEDGNLVFPGEERKFGLLDAKGRWIVSPQYGQIGDYEYGFRVFGDDVSDRFGLMDRYGKIVISPKYKKVEVDSKYVEVRDEDYVISYYKHDGQKIIEKVLERQ